MNQEIIKTISEELNVRVHQLEAVFSVLEEGNTVAVIARSRQGKIKYVQLINIINIK